MIYLFLGLIAYTIYILASRTNIFSRNARGKRKLELIEYAGAAAIFAMMLESIINGRAEVLWYPFAVMALIAVFYTRKIFLYLQRKEERPAS